MRDVMTEAVVAANNANLHGCGGARLGRGEIAFNRDSRVFAVFSAPLRPSPDPRTPP